MNNVISCTHFSLRRFACISLWALACGLSSTWAFSQPSTRAPVIRTPGRPSNPSGSTPSSRPPPTPPPAPPTPPPSVATPPVPTQPGSSVTPQDDPMASVKQAVKEIEWKPKGGGAVNFNLDDADLPTLVKAISNITGKRFIYGSKLKNITATVFSPEKISSAEAYNVFLSILETNGMTVIPHGRFFKIIETQGVVAQTTPIIGPAGAVPAEDRYITRLYRMNHIDAAEASQLLTKFKTRDADITIYPPGNLLIITETGSNLQRLLRIIEEVDVGSGGGGGGEQLWLEPIHYAAASEMATKLNEILDLKGSAGGSSSSRVGGRNVSFSGGGGARIFTEERTNSLIITATQQDYLRLLEIIKRLDVPQTGEGEIHVLPLQHAGCKELAGTLSTILGGAAGGGAANKRGGAAPVPGSAEDVFEGQIKVTCDEMSNKLVVTSSLRDYAQLRTVIDQLDKPRRQVYIEAVIMDVNVNRSNDFGLSYHGGAPFDVSDKQAIFMGGNNLKGGSLAGIPQNVEGLALGLRGPDLEGTSNLLGTGLSIPAFGVVMNALAKDGDSNVLATPHILATDNVAAEISIGQNIPLQTNVGGGLGALLGASGASAGGAAGLAGLSALSGLGSGMNAARQDVGTKIKVTPHVNDSDQVRLELSEEISEQGATAGDLGAAIINKRTANTTLIVRDQQTVVIGGLVRDAYVTGETKVPILGDIPVLGILFRQTHKEKTKTNLLLILTPYVIRDQDDLRSIFERKMQERQEFIDRYFVFSDTSNWEPPKDYSRTNGLIEQIRQAMISVAERVRLEEEAKPKGTRSHEPGEPIPIPSFGGPKAASSPVSPVPGRPLPQQLDNDFEPPQMPTEPIRPKNKIRVPGTPRNVDRAE